MQTFSQPGRFAGLMDDQGDEDEGSKDVDQQPKTEEQGGREDVTNES